MLCGHAFHNVDCFTMRSTNDPKNTKAGEKVNNQAASGDERELAGTLPFNFGLDFAIGRHIGAGTANAGFLPRPGIDEVVSRPGIDVVITLAGQDKVVVTEGQHRVVPLATDNDVVAHT